MQIYALDQDYQRISAFRATRGQNYYCLECHSLVRLRGGHRLHLHFYHLRKTLFCKQGGKSLEHLTLQLHIQKILRPEEIFLEYRFEAIQRIADVFWPSKSLIFEIQCSLIRPEEVEARQKDYASLGYQVVWILHERRFNKKRLSEAERTLRLLPHYFTNMDAKGRGKIYDQYVMEIGDRQLKKSLPWPIDLSSPLPTPSIATLPKSIKNRTLWPVYFKGDLLDKALHGSLLRHSAKRSARQRMHVWVRALRHLYLSCLYAMLNRTCD